MTPTPGRRESGAAAWIDGRLRAAPEVPLGDRGARNGEGLFETLRVEQGIPHHWQRHLERLVISAAELGFPVAPDPTLLRQALAEVLAANDLERAAAVARITMTRGVPGRRPARAGVWVEVEALEKRLWPGARTQSAHLMLSRRAFDAGFLARHKTTSRLVYELCREEGRAVSADETLLVDSAGRMLEGATSNVFAVIEGRLVTPPLTLPILPGIVRASVLALAPALGIVVIEAEVTREQLLLAEEVFVTNSIQEVVPAARLGDRLLPSRAIGSRLAASYRETAAEDRLHP